MVRRMGRNLLASLFVRGDWSLSKYLCQPFYPTNRECWAKTWLGERFSPLEHRWIWATSVFWSLRCTVNEENIKKRQQLIGNIVKVALYVINHSFSDSIPNCSKSNCLKPNLWRKTLGRHSEWHCSTWTRHCPHRKYTFRWIFSHVEWISRWTICRW